MLTGPKWSIKLNTHLNSVNNCSFFKGDFHSSSVNVSFNLQAPFIMFM